MITLRVRDGEVQRPRHLCLTRGDRYRVEVVWEGYKGCSLNRPWESVVFGANVEGDFDGDLLVLCDEWTDGVNEFDQLCSRGTLRLDDRRLRELIGENRELKLVAELQLENGATGERVTSRVDCFHVRNDVIKDEGGVEPSSGRVGESAWIFGEKAPEHTIVQDGSWLPIDDFRKLYETRQPDKWPTDVVDGRVCFQIPDLVEDLNLNGGAFIRAANKYVPVGEHQDDAMQNIHGYVIGVMTNDEAHHQAGDAFGWGEGGYGMGYTTGSGGTAATAAANLLFNAGNVVRVADETRPRCVSYLPVIFYR